MTFTSPNHDARFRLVCFPYGGGSSVVFREWHTQLPQSVQVCALDLPGRGPLMASEPYTDMRELIPALYDMVLPYSSKRFAFFGHSLGAVVAFELALYFREHGNTAPEMLFVSGAPAPHLRRSGRALHKLAKAELLIALRKFNGTPKEVLEHPELMELVLPFVRADFRLYETYDYKPGPPLACPIAAFGGTEDQSVTRRQVEAWCKQTAGNFSNYMLAGDHFFLTSNRTHLLSIISDQLKTLHKRPT
jgi:medium-chain acyl-[acyl-carrier-protein] hydrolase